MTCAHNNGVAYAVVIRSDGTYAESHCVMCGMLIKDARIPTEDQKRMSALMALLRG